MLNDDSLCEDILKSLSDTTEVDGIEWNIAEVTEPQAQLLASHLKQCAPSLKSFIFNCENITPQARSIILNALSEARSLQQLVLFDPLTATENNTVVGILNNNPGITDLYLASNELITADDVFNLRNLNNLSLIGFDLSNANFKNLTQLKRLNLRKCHLGDSLQQLADIPNITTIEVADVNLNEQQIKAISHYLTTYTVTQLALPNTKLNDQHASILLTGLLRNSAVVILDLQKNNLTPKTIDKISLLMKSKSLEQLQKLNLLHNPGITIFDKNLMKLQASLSSRASEARKKYSVKN